MLPTFIGLGAQRAGTTWVYNCLVEHPEVFMTKKKELHFFYVNYGCGLAWYESQFTDAAGAKARGEMTPDYMYYEVAKDESGLSRKDLRELTARVAADVEALSAMTGRDLRHWLA
jgi:Sulfotransferase family